MIYTHPLTHRRTHEHKLIHAQMFRLIDCECAPHRPICWWLALSVWCVCGLRQIDHTAALRSFPTHTDIIQSRIESNCAALYGHTKKWVEVAIRWGFSLCARVIRPHSAGNVWEGTHAEVQRWKCLSASVCERAWWLMECVWEWLI